MFKLTPIHRCAAALLGAMLSLPGSAATTAAASIAGLTFELIDLNLADGVGPSLSWNSPYATVEATRYSGQTVNLLPQLDGSVLWSVSFAHTATDAQQDSTSFLQALGASNPGVAASTGALALTASANVTSVGASGAASLSSFAYATGSFVLSANTELRITGQINTLASGPGSSGFVSPAGVAPDVGTVFSQANAYAELYLDPGSTTSTSTGTSYTPNTNPASFPTLAYADSNSMALGVSFRNETGADASGTFYALVQASASEITSTVPEPSSWAMLVAGLLGTAGLARRRRG